MVDCTVDEKGNPTWTGGMHVSACPKLAIRGGLGTRHTAGWLSRLAGGLEPKTDSPPGLNVYKYLNTKLASTTSPLSSHPHPQFVWRLHR
jgi:hypothetical protein